MPSSSPSAILVPGDRSLDRLRTLLVERTGLTVPDRDTARLVGIMDSHMRAARIGTRAEFVDRLEAADGDSGADWTALIGRLTVPESFFNRDPDQLAVVEHELLPELIARNSATRRLRLWSAGCATGEEPYTLAMMVDRLLGADPAWQVLILATDINDEYLDRARAGVFTEWSFRRMPPHERAASFTQVAGGWAIAERLRRMVTFERANLAADPLPTAAAHDMDLIMCRNVFIYFDRARTAEVARRLVAALSPGGYLVTGHTELVGMRLPGSRSRVFKATVAHQRQDRAGRDRIDAAVSPRRAPGRAAAPTTAPSTAGQTGAARQSASENDFDAVMARGYAAANTGDLAAAGAAARRARELQEFSAEPFLLEATLAELSGDADGARRLLDRALYLEPECVPALLTLAELHEAAGNGPRAAALRTRAEALSERDLYQ